MIPPVRIACVGVDPVGAAVTRVPALPCGEAVPRCGAGAG
jgi:hypothetical protein